MRRYPVQIASFIESDLMNNRTISAKAVKDILWASENLDEAKAKFKKLIHDDIRAEWHSEYEKDDAILKKYQLFEDIFFFKEDYERIILAMIEEKFIQPSSPIVSHDGKPLKIIYPFEWIDNKPGYKNDLVSIFRTCHKKGRTVLEEFDIRIYQIIAYETFRVSLSDRILKGSKPFLEKDPRRLYQKL